MPPPFCAVLPEAFEHGNSTIPGDMLMISIPENEAERVTFWSLFGRGFTNGFEGRTAADGLRAGWDLVCGADWQSVGELTALNGGVMM